MSVSVSVSVPVPVPAPTRLSLSVCLAGCVADDRHRQRQRQTTSVASSVPLPSLLSVGQYIPSFRGTVGFSEAQVFVFSQLDLIEYWIKRIENTMT